MLQTLSSHHVYGDYFSASAWKQNGCVIKLLDTFFRSCAHDSCRWYQDYRNEKEKKIRSTKKQLLGLAVFCPRWVCFPNIIISEQQRSQFPTRKAIILPVYFCVERLLCPGRKYLSTSNPRQNLGALFSTTCHLWWGLHCQSNSSTMATLTTGGTFRQLLCRITILYRYDGVLIIIPNVNLLTLKKQRLQPPS